jgi:hypothetical protein
MTEDFQLTDGEKAHPLWARLRAHLEGRLDEMRRRNDAPQSEQDTAALRGQIRSIQGIIALGDSRPLTGL